MPAWTADDGDGDGGEQRADGVEGVSRALAGVGHRLHRRHERHDDQRGREREQPAPVSDVDQDR
jgi:hypothetical protein